MGKEGEWDYLSLEELKNLERARTNYVCELYDRYKAQGKNPDDQSDLLDLERERCRMANEINRRQGIKNCKVSGGNSGGSGCFIATAVYEDYDHPSVLVLRNFRDQVLLPTTFGKAFVRVYYALSPMLAKRIRNQYLKQVIRRAMLNPIVKWCHHRQEK